MSRKEASGFNWLSNQFDDRYCRSAKTCVALEWKLLCFYQVSVYRRPLQRKIVLFENTSSSWAETIREKEE